MERMTGDEIGEGAWGCIMQDNVVQAKDCSVLAVKNAHKRVNP